jgi:hypothetical protein
VSIAPDSEFFNYAIFLTDLEHQVLPVIEGVRAALQYDLYLEDDKDFTAAVKNISQEDEMMTDSSSESLLNPMLGDFFQVHGQDASVSFLLNHQYPFGVRPENLKGTDRLLYKEVTKEYEVVLGCGINKDWFWDGDRMGSANKYRVADAECLINLVDHVKGQERVPLRGPVKLAKDGKTPNTFLFFGSEMGWKLASKTSEYTGNDGVDTELTYRSTTLSIAKRKQ